MSRIGMYLILGLLIVVLGAMSYIVQRAGKPEPPKPPTAAEAEARQKAVQERMQQEAEARKKMLQKIKATEEAAKKSAAAQSGSKRPVNPTAPPPPPKVKNTVPPGALDISEDWFKKRKPGDAGLRELEKQQASQQPVSPPPAAATAPTIPSR